MKKYNLALTPISKNNEFITLAQQFSHITDKYLLGKKSLPHVTLYHFSAKESAIDDIWQQANQSWVEKPIHLTFNTYSYTTSNNKIYWIALLPNHIDTLHKMHAIIANITNQPIKHSFDPHLTLTNTQNNHYQNEIDRLSPSLTPISDAFQLTLGKSDEIGQLTEIIYRRDITL